MLNFFKEELAKIPISHIAFVVLFIFRLLRLRQKLYESRGFILFIALLPVPKTVPSAS